MTYAQADLQDIKSQHGQGIVMVARVELADSSDHTKALIALVRELRLEASRGKYPQSIQRRLKKLYKNNFTRISESTVANTVSIKAIPVPGLETSFSRKSDRTSTPTEGSLTESGLIDVISEFLDASESKKSKKPNLLENLIEKVLNSNRIPSRIIIVLDKIDSEDAFQVLQSLRIFSDDRITFFAIVQNEDFQKWSSSTKKMINKIGFRDYYVPCIWEEDYNLIRDMIHETVSPDKFSYKQMKEFIDHIAYKTRGAPGDIVKELVSLEYNTYKGGELQLSLDTMAL